MSDHSISRRGILQAAGGGAALGAVAVFGPTTTTPAAAEPGRPEVSTMIEPDAEAARTWWPPQRQVWTPVGWKGHLFRFDTFYNGAIISHPAVALPPSSAPTLKPYLKPYVGKDFQVTPVMPQGSGFPALSQTPYYLYKSDYGVGLQGWRTDTETPVLWTEHRRQAGLVLRQETFGHLKGGGEVDTADEPIYAWTRFVVDHVDEHDAPDEFTFVLRLSKVLYKHYVGPPEQQEAFLTIQVSPDAAPLDGPLKIDRIWNPDGKPLTVPIYDHEDQVRMIIGTPAGGTISLVPAEGHDHVYDLKLGLPVKKGTAIDVLLPAVPQAKDEALREWGIGRAAALAESDAFWADEPQTSTELITPEAHVNDYFRRSVQLAEVIAEKSPDSGKYSFLTGSFGYDLLWSTPTSMIGHMFLDLLGRHEVVARHIDLYLDVQGKRKPPGAAYQTLPSDGFFATPLSLQSFDWLGDHGAILEVAARHALLSWDAAYTKRWLPAIIKACEFIKSAVEFKDHDGVQGLMPAAASNDTGVEQQSIWIQVWNYKGLASSVELLRREKHPRAEEFGKVADAFRTAFVTALRAIAADAPRWTDPDGKTHPIIPSKFHGPTSPWPYLEAFDTGALTAVWAGLLPATDELMRSYVEFYRVGPNTKFFDPWHHTALDRVVLDHEQSSGEPCYSWNLFHTWQLGDRARFLEGLYGLMMGACSDNTFISGEHRNAMYGTLFVQPLVTWAARTALVDDGLDPDELHLLRLCPLAWLVDGSPTKLLRAPTRYGTVSLELSRDDGNRTLNVKFGSDWKRKPQRIVLHPPPIPDLLTVTVNGRRYGARKPIEL
ncbi:hypothetical protein [Microlunatus speluncae]|uniref:hypothetical protein n=1 Tax=Microlunatus speluncae TaxID=2594267 RepID=UPI0012667368|nr:hypothetical protein [Microlunatus speluncae]